MKLLPTFQPQLPALPLDQCSNEERWIDTKRAMWPLADLQQLLASREWRLQLTQSAASDANVKLNWGPDVIRPFFNSLGSHRYVGSEWAFMSRADGTQTPLIADAYAMGFSRVTLKENQMLSPPVYIKFTAKAEQKLILVLRLHPSTKS